MSAADLAALPRRNLGALRLLANLVARPGGALGVLCMGVMLVCAALAPWIAPFDPIETDVGMRLAAPDATHWLGTDLHGRDVFSRVVWGARYSLPVGFATLFLGLTVGSVIGLILGFTGGKVDMVGSRIIDVMLGFPQTVMAIMVVSVLGVGLVNVVIAVAIADVPSFARVARGAVISARQNLFVESATAMGARPMRVMLVHILPTITPVLILLGTLNLGGAVLSTATLSFLGLGTQPPTPEWGSMLNDGRDYMRYAPWMMLAPGVALFVAIMSVNLIGDRLSLLLDPRNRGRG